MYLLGWMPVTAEKVEMTEPIEMVEVLEPAETVELLVEDLLVLRSEMEMKLHQPRKKSPRQR